MSKNSKLKLNRDYSFDDDTMEILGIPKIDLINNIEEKWRFVKLDRHPECNRDKKYMVSNYGRVYHYDKWEMLKLEESNFFKTSIHPYIIAKLKVGKKSSIYLVHRLVMLAFTKPIEGKPIVNHIDGDPSHNYLWNLEWSNTRENYIHALKTSLKIEKYGEERYNALWSDKEIAMICKMMEDGHKATFIYDTLLKMFPNDERIKYERIRTLYKHIIRKTHWTQISKDFDIDFSKFNYLKEPGSVKKAKDKKERKTL